MDPKYLLIPAVIFVLGWFAYGVIYNLRRGEAMLRWMQSGLPQVGERTTLRWLGSSVAVMGIAKAKGPIRSLETLLVMAPRDVPWLWLLSSLQGRRDTLIFRAQLGTPPPVDLELIDPASWTGRTAMQEAVQRGWESQPYRDMKLLAPPGLLHLAQVTLERLELPARNLAPRYRRFGLRRGSPHLELHLAFPNPRQADAAEFFRALVGLARAAGERG